MTGVLRLGVDTPTTGLRGWFLMSTTVRHTVQP